MTNPCSPKRGVHEPFRQACQPRNASAMSEGRDIWLMLAFPGESTGHYALRAFAPSASGKSWYRKLATRDQAIACKRELVAAGIKYLCKKVPEKGRKFPQHRQSIAGRFGGKLNAQPIGGAWRMRKNRR